MRATEFIRPHTMAKIAKTGRIVELLKHKDQVDFSDERGWFLINTEPGKRVTPDIKWIPDSTRFEWVKEFADLKEFALSPERDDNDDVPDQLVVLANRWWNATDRQPQIEHVLNSLGWSIQQVESEDDAVQLQHRDGTTYFISADDFDPDLFEYRESKSKQAHRAGKGLQSRKDQFKSFQVAMR
jgi:hypothetical protein